MTEENNVKEVEVSEDQVETFESQETGPVTDDDDAGFEDLSMEELEALYSESVQDFREGEVVRGKVIEVSADRVLVDIGYKSEGIVSLHEFPDSGSLKPGDEFDVFIEQPENENGMPVLSKIKADRIKYWEHVQEVYDNDGSIEGRVMRRVKGGFKVDVGVDAFMPASQLTWRPTGDLQRYVGETMEVKIIKLTKRRRNVVVSRRKLLEEQRAGEKQHLLDNIEIGKILPGEVKNITDFGAFVDVGGIDGLLHVTDMSWGRVKHPSQVVGVGDKIEVMVLNFDPKTERISLGLKQKTENPWQMAVDKYTVGAIARGKVVSMTDYGAFVRLEEGIEGMVHVSEMSWTRRVRHPNEVVALDGDIDVMILSVDPDNEKIALGIKQTLPNPWNEMEAKYPVGSSAKGIVRTILDYGAFMELEEGIDGLLHVSDISWTKKVSHPSEILEKGQEIEVKILSVDAVNEKIGVGLKQLDRDPWQEVLEALPVGSHVEVEVAKLVSFGAFARLESGIEGLIHVSELSQERVQKPEEILSVGDKVMAKVISIDPSERKLGLSMREYQRDLDSDGTEEYEERASSPRAVNVDDAVGDAVPQSLLHAGRTFTDAANEMMAQLNAIQVSNGSDAPVETAKETSEAPAEPSAEAAPEKVAKEPTEEAAPEKVAEEPVEEAAPEKVAEEPVEEAAPEKVAEEPVEEAAAEKVAEEPVEEAAAEKVAEEPVEEAAAEKADEATEAADAADADVSEPADAVEKADEAAVEDENAEEKSE